MDPFGAKSPSLSSLQSIIFEDSNAEPIYNISEQTIRFRGPASIEGKNQDAKISFYPPRKLWHRSFDLNITVYDPTGLDNNSRVRFIYDGEDISERVLSYAKIHYGQDGKGIRFTIPAFRLLPEQDKSFMVAYARLDPLGNDYVIGKVYEEPYCPLTNFQKLDMTSKLKGFTREENLVNQIQALASFHQINPALIAGLIAQESSFDPKAVSSSKAIGLTQITAPAEQHVFEGLGDSASTWPRYPGLSDMNTLRIKTLVSLGKINARNEWRLNHEFSILGGISYLRYIQDYWVSFSPLINQQIKPYSFEHQQNTMVDLILASYNSGPYRVRKNLARYGKNWLEAPDLGEARKYVHNIKSYCYDFARGY